MKRGKSYIEAGWNRVLNNKSDISLTHAEIDMLIETAKEQGHIAAGIIDAYYMGIEAGARMIERRC